MTMSNVDERYFVYENRLASFSVAKRRASNANSRAPKALSWPHKSLAPADLAKAGFFFQPDASNPDNVNCFLCEKSLAGWEEDDDPLAEHLKHSPSCGWAIVASIEAEIGNFGSLHPLDPTMVEARKATFAGKWPYEAKKGFKCKTKQLVEAGWKYTPTLNSDDMTTCTYCDLALDGWESGDKPFDEHYKRAAHCPFFELVRQNGPPKKGRTAKAVRTSKASRLSSQSVATLASMADITADVDDSVLTVTSVMTQDSKKTGRGKRAGTTRAKKTRAKKDEAIEIKEDEPETEMPPPPKPARGRKRASDAVEDSIVTNAEAPAPKKRATKSRVSNSVNDSILTVASHDTDMPDAPAKSGGVKKKGSRRSSANSTRNVSTTLQAPAVPDDDELDRLLQADLERPLTDDEGLAADSDSERIRAAPAKAKAKGRPRKGTVSKKGAGSKEEEPANYAMFNPVPIAPSEEEIEAELQALEAEVGDADKPEVLEVPKKGRKAGTRKVSKQTKKAKEPTPRVDTLDDELNDDDVMLIQPANKPVEKGETVSIPNTDKTSKRVSSGRSATDEATRSSLRGTEPTTQAPTVVERPELREPLSASNRAANKQVSDKPAASAPKQTQKALPPVPAPRALPPPPATPRGGGTVHISPTASAKQANLSPSQSPQSSDAENQPPSSKPASSAGKRTNATPAPAVVAATPSGRRVIAGLQSTTPWEAADLDLVFALAGEGGAAGAGDEALLLLRGGKERLSSPERDMTVEQWIFHNAGLAEQMLKQECEAMVSGFEREGGRAMVVLEGLVVE